MIKEFRENKIYLYYMATFKYGGYKIDDYMTPYEAWENIKQYIPSNKIIWEPFYGDGTSGDYLRKLGYTVIHEKEDFFNNNKGDIIITNPPFSMAEEVLERLKILNKPFIIIMPVSKIATKYFKKNFKNEIQLIIPKSRIHFKKYIIKCSKSAFFNIIILHF